MSVAKALSRKSMALGPSVRLLLNRHSINPKQIASTGPHETLLKSDVLAYLSSPNLTKTENPIARKSVGKRGEVTFVLDENEARRIYARKPISEEEIEAINVLHP